MLCRILESCQSLFKTSFLGGAIQCGPKVVKVQAIIRAPFPLRSWRAFATLREIKTRFSPRRKEPQSSPSCLLLIAHFFNLRFSSSSLNCTHFLVARTFHLPHFDGTLDKSQYSIGSVQRELRVQFIDFFVKLKLSEQLRIAQFM